MQMSMLHCVHGHTHHQQYYHRNSITSEFSPSSYSIVSVSHDEIAPSSVVDQDQQPIQGSPWVTVERCQNHKAKHIMVRGLRSGFSSRVVAPKTNNANTTHHVQVQARILQRDHNEIICISLLQMKLSLFS